MVQQLLMALGAGAASAVLFVVPAKGSMFAMFLGVIAPLPLMIAALGLGERIGVAAALVGGAVIAIMIDSYVAGVFLLSVAAPALLLGFLARRPAHGAPGTLLLAVAVASMLVGWIGLGAIALKYPSLEAALDDLVKQMTPLAKSMMDAADMSDSGYEPAELTRWIVLGMAPVGAAWGVAALALNFWLAGRVAFISGMLPRAWPDLPENLRLPRSAFALLGIALAACLAPGVVRLLAATAVAALLVAFALHGLATLHALTRARAARPAMLAGFYALSLALFPWPLVLAAGLGLTDVARPLRRVAIPIDPPLNNN